MNRSISAYANTSEAKLSKRIKLGFGVGDMGNGMMLNLKSIFMLYFWTDVFGITAGMAGLIFLFVRIWDGVNDPMMGYIADHTQSRWGRYRPYLLFGGVPLGIMAVLTFTVPDLTMTGKIIWAASTYCLFGMMATMVGVPYNALIPVITQDPKQRTSLATAKGFFYYLSVLIVGVATKPLVALFADEKTGFQVTVSIYAMFACIVLWVTFSSYHEKPIAKADRATYRIRDVFRIIGLNRPLQLMFGAAFAVTLAGALQMSSALYFCKYNLDNEKYFPALISVILISMLVGSVLSPIVGARLGKRGAYLTAVVMYIIAYSAMFFVPYSQIAWILILSFFAGLGNGIAYVLSFSMLADTVEYSEWKTGIRSEGVIFSSCTLVVKLGGAISSAISGLVLTMSGYVANVTQSPSALTGILLMITLIPVGVKLIAFVLIYFYKLDSTTHASIVEDLKNARYCQTLNA